MERGKEQTKRQMKRQRFNERCKRERQEGRTVAGSQRRLGKIMDWKRQRLLSLSKDRKEKAASWQNRKMLAVLKECTSRDLLCLLQFRTRILKEIATYNPNTKTIHETPLGTVPWQAMWAMGRHGIKHVYCDGKLPEWSQWWYHLRQFQYKMQWTWIHRNSPRTNSSSPSPHLNALKRSIMHFRNGSRK